MANTESLEAPLLDQNVAQPEVPHNEALVIVDSAVAGQLTIDINDNVNYTLDDTSLTYPQEWQYGTLIITNTGIANTGVVSVIVPDSKIMRYVLVNDSSSGLGVQLITATGTGITVPDGSIYQMLSDGIDIRRIN